LEITKSNFPKEIDIRGEVFIENNDFKKLMTSLQILEMLLLDR